MDLREWLERKQAAEAARDAKLCALPICYSQGIHMVGLIVTSPGYNGALADVWSPN